MPFLSPDTPDPNDERRRDAERKRKKRASAGEITLPPIAEPERRRACEKDPFLFLPTYGPDVFTDPFVDQQLEIGSQILYRAQFGGAKALAAPRGSAKTTLAEWLIIFCLLARLPLVEIIRSYLRFPLVVAANAHDAERILNNIKYQFEFNDLLAADYPEVCIPIRELEGAPQRANKQTIGGLPTHLKWSDKLTVFAHVPAPFGLYGTGSITGGAVLMTRGLDAPIRGIRYLSQRPDYVLMDDIETRESAKHDSQIEDRKQTVLRDVAGLAGPGKRMAMIMCGTIQNRKCLTAQMTDPEQMPGFDGSRYKFLLEPPEREDLWEEYTRLYIAGKESRRDPDGRAAMGFYLTNREAMDVGAVVANPNRFIKDILPAARSTSLARAADARPAEAGTASGGTPGSPVEISAVQHYYNYVANWGLDSALSELQNDPPEIVGPQTSGITASLVAGRLNQRPRRLVPRDCVALTAFIDLGDRGLHWTVIAWLPGFAGLVIDYGVEDVNNPEKGIDQAIVRALHTRREHWQHNPYLTEAPAAGELQMERPLDKCLIDSGDGERTKTVYGFLHEIGGGQRDSTWLPSKGMGRGKFHQKEKSPSFIPGHSCYRSRQKADNLWLVGMDADFWKLFVQERFLTPTFNDDGTIRRGSLSLWGDNNKEHQTFARNIVAEEWRDIFVEGKGTRKGFYELSPNNHKLDCAYGCAVGASLCGVRLIDVQVAPRRPQQGSWFAQQRRRSG